jgi:hypothetical protein
VLQAGWLLVLAACIFFYWTRIRGRDEWASVIFTLPFLMFYGIFGFDGGLSDFRLDLSLYIFTSITLAIYLVTEEIDRPRIWFLAGVAAGLTCLTRGTAPIYFGVMLGPLLLFRLWRAESRGRLLRHIGIMLAPAVILASTFIVANYSYLYYYYVVWNADANARLPLHRSIIHIGLGLEHIGAALLPALAYFGLVVLGENVFGAKSAGLRKTLRDVDWKFLYLGFAPLVFLALRGAGLNPFVSMPAVFGFTMFALAPLKGRVPVPISRFSAFAAVGLILACGWNAVSAVGRHLPNPCPRMDALKASIETMRADAESRGLKRVSFLTSHIWNFQTEYLRNVLIYEYGGDAYDGQVVERGGMAWITPHDEAFGAPVPVVWNQIAGANDAEKIETMFRMAHNDVDYMLFPDDPTIDVLERDVPYNFINLKVRAIKKRFLESGEWVPLGGLLAITRQERVQIYAKRLPR